MVYSDTTTFTGIIQDIDFWVLGSSATASTDYVIADKTRNANRWYDRAVSLILQADQRWEWDDTNHTDLPIATTTLVDSQQDYCLDTSFLEIDRAEVKDSAGNYQRIKPISQEDINNQSMTEYLKTPGMPREYDLLGNSILLYPKPSSTATTLVKGLKVYFQRSVDYFTVTDTTQKPGFASMFHRLLSVGAALDYCIANALGDRINLLKGEIARLEAGILKYYARRNRDDQAHMDLQREDYGQYGAGIGLGLRGTDEV